jgi:glucose/arabinose dehydrogenase
LGLLAFAPRAVPAVPPSLQNAFPNLPAFNWPVVLQAPFDGSDRLFVSEKAGKIYVFDNDPSVSTRTLFLDISGQVNSAGEGGLVGLVFHPDYESNGTFFVMYGTIGERRSRWSRLQVSPDPDVADPASEVTILEIPQTNVCHKGGDMAFGADGYLYLAVGDDCEGFPAQSLASLKGKLLRIDVDNTSPGRQYAIPPDNPFAGNLQGWREEIYAFGFRNPWRFSIDPETNRIWLGDVGENTFEEINIVLKGRNYGWIKMEGTNCYPNPLVCDTTGTNNVLPLWQYAHTGEVGEAIIGGYVYRGHTVPSLWGRYLCAENGNGLIFALTYDGVTVTSELIYDVKPSKQFSTFGVDEDDELYVVSLYGQIYRFVDSPSDVGARPPTVAALVAAPNPFQTSTTLRFESIAFGAARIEVYDVRGRRVRALRAGPSLRVITWDGTDHAGRDLESGVYFARLILDGRVAADQRIVLVR